MNGIRYDITGPGILRASQEAVDARKQLVIVYDQDASGRPVRVGYFLESTGAQPSNETEVKWFPKDEIEIKSIVMDNIPTDIKARLDIGFTHPRKEEKHFLLDFPVGPEQQVLIRCLFRIRKGSITDFVIQVEIKGLFNGHEKWRPTVRYDCAHGFIHRDLIAINGKKSKSELPIQTQKQAVLFAIDEIIKELSAWLQQLGYKQLDPHLVDNPLVVADLEKAKTRLLELLDNPKAIDGTTESHLVLVR